MVHTKDGLKAIEEIHIGDLVLSKRNGAESAHEYKRVTRTVRCADREVICVNFVTGESSGDPVFHRVVVTPEQQFWVNRKRWREAISLKSTYPATESQSASQDNLEIITSVRLFRTDQPNIAWIPSGRPDELRCYGSYLNVPKLTLSRHGDVSLHFPDASRTGKVKPEYLYRSDVFGLEIEEFGAYFVSEPGILVAATNGEAANRQHDALYAILADEHAHKSKVEKKISKPAPVPIEFREAVDSSLWRLTDRFGGQIIYYCTDSRNYSWTYYFCLDLNIKFKIIIRLWVDCGELFFDLTFQSNYSDGALPVAVAVSKRCSEIDGFAIKSMLPPGPDDLWEETSKGPIDNLISIRRRAHFRATGDLVEEDTKVWRKIANSSPNSLNIIPALQPFQMWKIDNPGVVSPAVEQMFNISLRFIEKCRTIQGLDWLYNSPDPEAAYIFQENRFNLDIYCSDINSIARGIYFSWGSDSSDFEDVCNYYLDVCRLECSQEELDRTHDPLVQISSLIDVLRQIPRPTPETERRPGFVAGTLVHTSEGMKQIEQIVVGDMVLSRDVLHGGADQYKAVTQTYSSNNQFVTYLLCGTESVSQDFLLSCEQKVWIDGHGWIMLDIARRELNSYLRTHKHGGVQLLKNRKLMPTMKPGFGRFWDGSYVIQGEKSSAISLDTLEIFADNSESDWTVSLGVHPSALLREKVYGLCVDDFNNCFIGGIGLLVQTEPPRTP